MNKFKPKMEHKKGLAGTGLVMMVLAIVGIVSLGMWLTGNLSTKTTSLTVVQEGSTPSAVTAGLTFTEDTTVTVSSQDAYASGTDAGTSNFFVNLGGLTAIQVADDGTQTASPNDAYIVYIGNATQALTAGTSYYPVYLTGSIPDKGTYTINAGQYLTGGVSQLTYTYFNVNEQVNTAEAMGANDQATVQWKITANDNVCVGNPTAGGDNAMSYTYNTTVFSDVVQLDSSSNNQVAISTPTSVTAVAGKATRTYTFPVVCDNADVKRKVLLRTLTAPVADQDHINMTFHDVSVDRNEDTLAKIVGYADEDNNDIGIADVAIPTGLLVS